MRFSVHQFDQARPGDTKAEVLDLAAGLCPCKNVWLSYLYHSSEFHTVVSWIFIYVEWRNPVYMKVSPSALSFSALRYIMDIARVFAVPCMYSTERYSHMVFTGDRLALGCGL